MPVSYSTDAINPTQHNSVVNLELSHTNLLPFSIQCTDSEIVIDDYRSIEDKNTVTSLVLVGQSISIRLIAALCQRINIESLSVKMHPMHMKLGQYVYIIEACNASISQAVLNQLSDEFFIDIFPQSSIPLAAAGVLVMDMDSTVIAMECIDEIAALAGVKAQVSEVTERAMRGEIAFTDSLHHRVACLKGIPISELETIRSRLPFSPKFMQTMQVLRQHGWTLVLASGGFTFFADHIKALAQLDYAYSNTLAEGEGILTGEVIGDVVDADRKSEILQQVAKTHGIAMENTIAIGDGANDLKMMKAAGWSIAYRAKPAVRSEASASINASDFDSLLYMLR